MATQLYQQFTGRECQRRSYILHGLDPEDGFLTTRWETYAEMMMLYLLAIGATVNPIPASAWQAFARPTLTYQGPDLHYEFGARAVYSSVSHAWFDFRNVQDAMPTTSTIRSTATQAHNCSVCRLAGQFSDYSANSGGSRRRTR